jgi:hypothetical protein
MRKPRGVESVIDEAFCACGEAEGRGGPWKPGRVEAACYAPGRGAFVLRKEAAGGDAPFQAVAVDAWRAFRRHLDHCVHYAECRICELVSLLT